MQRQIGDIGAGCRKRVADILHRQRTRALFRVAGPHAGRASGAAPTVAPLLAPCAVTPNRSQQTIEDAWRLFSTAPGDVILAVVGGLLTAMLEEIH